MTVKELLEELMQYDDEENVFVDAHSDICEIQNIERINDDVTIVGKQVF